MHVAYMRVCAYLRLHEENKWRERERVVAVRRPSNQDKFARLRVKKDEGGRDDRTMESKKGRVIERRGSRVRTGAEEERRGSGGVETRKRSMQDEEIERKAVQRDSRRRRGRSGVASK